MRCRKVVLPEPAMPTHTIATGGWAVGGAVGLVDVAMAGGGEGLREGLLVIRMVVLIEEARRCLRVHRVKGG